MAHISVIVKEIEPKFCPYCTRQKKATHVVSVIGWHGAYGHGSAEGHGWGMCEAHAREVAAALKEQIVPLRRKGKPSNEETTT